MAHSRKAGSHRSCAHVLVAERRDGKISCPTHRRANEPHGCPWLYKQSGEDEVTDPAAWTTESLELCGNVFAGRAYEDDDQANMRVATRAIFIKQPGAIKDRRMAELSMEELHERRLRDPLRVDSHRLEWIDCSAPRRTIGSVLNREYASKGWHTEAWRRWAARCCRDPRHSVTG